MALTKVTGGILSQPIDLGITTATTGFFSGIVTAQSVRVLGDLIVDGSTTTLDTVVTEVDRLEVGANNTTVGVAITQSGTGDILKLYDSSTPVFAVKDGGKVGIGTDNPSGLMHLYGSSPQLYFTDSDTNVESFFDHDSSSGNFALNIDHNDNAPGDNSKFIIRFHATGGAAGGDKFSIDQNGNVGINTTNTTGSKALTNNTAVLAVGIVTTNSLFSSELKVADNGSIDVVNPNPGNAVLDIINSGNGNVSGINFIRERGNGQTDRNGGSIFMPSNTANNEAFLYIQAQSASAHAGVTGALSANNGVRLKLHGDDGIFSVETGADERLRITSDGNVGIGTDNVQTLLHLKGTGDVSSGIRFDNSHDNVNAYFHNDSNDSDFLITYGGTGGAELTIHADGNLGLNEANGDDVLIGTSSVIDNSKLTIVKGEPGFTTAIALGNGHGSGDGSKIISTKSLVLGADYDANNGDHKSYLGFETDGEERLRIASDGNIGIGTASPETLLTLGASSNPVLEFKDYTNNARSQILGSAGGQLIFQTDITRVNANSDFIFRADGGDSTYEIVRFKDTGEVGIGTNDPETNLTIAKNATNQTVATIPTVRLTNLDTTAVATDIVGSYEFFSKDVHSNDKVTGFMRNTPTDAGVNYDLTFGTIKTSDSNAVERLRITSDGGIILKRASLAKIITDATDKAIYIAGGNDTIVGGNINLFGSTHASHANHLRFRSGSTVAMEIDESGKIGIGTENPDHNLHVYQGDDDAVITIESRGNGNHSALEFYRTSSGGDSKGAGSIYVTGDTSTSVAKMKFGVAHNISHGTHPRMTIEGANGRVGIGTENPVEVLHVHQSGTTAAEFRLENSEGYILLRSDNNLATYDAQQHIFRSRDGSDEYGKFDSDGNLGIGTNNPETKVHIYDASADPYLKIGGSGRDCGIQLDAATNFTAFRTDAANRLFVNAGADSIRFSIGGSSNEKLRILSSGHIVTQGLTGTSFNNDTSNAKILEVTGDGTVDEYGVINISGNSNSDEGTIGRIYFINRENSNSSSVGDANSKALAYIDVYTNSADNNAGDDCGGDLRFSTKRDGAGALERIRITADGRIGINDNTPNNYELDIRNRSDSTGNDTQIRIYNTQTDSTNDTVIRNQIAGTTANNYIYFGDGDDTNSGQIRYNHSNNFMSFKTNDEEQLRITNVGYVGIGTISPSKILHTYNDGAVGSTENDRKYNGRFTTFTPNKLNLDIYDRRWSNGNTHGWEGTEKRIEYNVDDNTNKRMWMSFFNPDNGTLNNVIRFGEQEDTEWMRIKDGYLGIGESDPSSSLVVRSSDNTLGIFTSTDAGANIDLFDDTTQSRIRTINGRLHLYSDFENNVSDSVIRFFIDGNNEKVRIESDGKVGIGTDDPASFLHLFTETGDCVLTLEADRGNSSSNENDNPYIVFKQDGSTAMSAIGMNPNGENSESNSLVLVNGAGSGAILFKTGEGGSYTSGTSQRLKIHPDGDVSIYNDARISGICTANTGFMFGTDGQHYLYQSASDQISLRITSDGPYAQFKDESGDVQMGSSSGTLRLSAGGDEKVRIMSSGSIGIRTTTGTNTVNIGGAAGLGVKFHNFTSGNSSYITVESGDKLQSNVGGTGYYTWVTGGSEKVRIANNGNVGINSTSPQKQLDIVGDDGLLIRTSTNGGTGNTGGATIMMSDQQPGNDQAGLIKYRHPDGNTPGDNYGSAFYVTSGTPNTAFMIGDFEYDNTTGNNDLLVKTNIGIGTHTISRGPLQIHSRSNNDIQIHMTNNETGVGSGNGFTIFGGAGTNGRDMGFVNRETTGAIEFFTNIDGTLAQRGGWHTGSEITTFCINTASNGINSNLLLSNHDITDYNGIANRSEYPMYTDIHFTGSDTISGGNKTHAAWRNDVEMSITNNTSNSSGNRLQVYGIHSTLNATKYAYILYGAYLFCNSSANNAVHTQTLIGAYGYAQGYINASSSAQGANIYGGHFIGYRGGSTKGGHCYGAIARAQQTTNGDVHKTGDMTGVLGEVEVDEGQITNGYSFRAMIDVDNNTGDGVSAASTITSGYLYHGTYSIASGTTVTNRRGIWLTGCTDNNIEGTLTVGGDITAPNNKSFRIPHPLVGLSTTKDLVHAAIEGPQVDLIYRGKTTLVAGISTVNLDTKSGMTEGTFVALNRDVQCFTTNETGWTNVKGSVTGNQLTIIAQENTCTDTISWMVIGERQDDSIKSAALTDADGKLILEPDRRQEFDEDPVKYECEDNIHNADPNHNPKDD